MIDDFELKAVQQVCQETHQDFGKHRVIGLEGTLHQKLGRRSHRVWLWGYLLPTTAADDLKTLQEKAAAGAEVTFTADIVTALEVQKMVIESFQAEQRVGPAGQTAYAITLAEAPPLPPPAEVSSFGGLGGVDGFGLGDLGFDAGALGGVLDDVANVAGEVMDAVDTALDAVGQLSALADLANIANIGNPLGPVTEKVGELGNLAGPAAELRTAAGEIQP
jgi:hypothetical protein